AAPRHRRRARRDWKPPHFAGIRVTSISAAQGSTPLASAPGSDLAALPDLDGRPGCSGAPSATEADMAIGTVKWFNPTKGYGFIQPENGGKDVFVHISAVEQAGLKSLNEGQKISYELATTKGKTSAANLKLAD